MNIENIREEIGNAFNFVAKPAHGAFLVRRDNRYDCQHVKEALDSYNEMELPPQALRHLHSDLSCLSPKGFRWALPSYLRYCVSDPALLYRDELVETEFLIYHLSHELEYQAEVTQQLSVLNSQQIDCLISFVDWCKEGDWGEYYSDHLTKAHDFLVTLRKP